MECICYISQIKMGYTLFVSMVGANSIGVS